MQRATGRAPASPVVPGPRRARLPCSISARAPESITRAVPRRTFAPTALAPIAPRKAKKPKDAADTMGLKLIRAVTLGRKRGRKGGRGRADKMSAAERAEIARKPPPMSRCRRSPPSASQAVAPLEDSAPSLRSPQRRDAPKRSLLQNCPTASLRPPGPRAGSQIDRLPVKPETASGKFGGYCTAIHRMLHRDSQSTRIQYRAGTYISSGTGPQRRAACS